MNAFQCEKQGANTYMVYEISKEEEVDSLSLGMLLNNKIRGLAPVIYGQMDEVQCLRYNISSKTSLSQYLTGILSRERILKIFRLVTEALLEAEEYMIEPSSILLSPEHVFVDSQTGETVLICLPLMNIEGKDVSAFFKNIMFGSNAIFDSRENCDYVARIINHLNGAETFSLVNFRGLLMELEKETQEMQGVARVNVAPRAGIVPGATGSNVVPGMSGTQGASGRSGTPGVSGMQGGVRRSAMLGANSMFGVENMSGEKNMLEVQNVSEIRNVPEVSSAFMGRNVQDMQGMSEMGATSERVNTSGQNVKQPQSVGFAIPGTAVTEPSDEKEEKKKWSLFGGKSDKEEKNKKGGGKKKSAKKEQNEKNKGGILGALFGGKKSNNGNGEEGDDGSDDTVLYEETTLLDNQPRLIRTKTQETIFLQKDEFRIGRDKESADYCIDHTSISHFHATIIRQGEDFYIMDMGSKNHTYVNGIRIESNVPVYLENQATIKMASEIFVFEIDENE